MNRNLAENIPFQQFCYFFPFSTSTKLFVARHEHIHLENVRGDTKEKKIYFNRNQQNQTTAVCP